MTVEKQPWQPWQLTAYVLGELEPEVAQQIAEAAASDTVIAAEIASLRSTVAQVTQLYQHESADILPTRLAAIEAASSTAVPAEGLSAAVEQIVSIDHQVSRSSGTARASRSNRLAWIGLLTLSASLLVAVFLSTPAATSWLLSQNDLKLNDHVDGQVRPAETVAEVDRHNALRDQSDEVDSELGQTTTTRVAAATSPAPISGPVPTADKLQASGATTSYGSVANASDAEVAATGGPQQRNAEADISGDVQIEFIEEVDLVILRGSKADVQRTLGVIEEMKATDKQKAPVLKEEVLDAVPNSNKKLADAKKSEEARFSVLESVVESAPIAPADSFGEMGGYGRVTAGGSMLAYDAAGMALQRELDSKSGSTQPAQGSVESQQRRSKSFERMQSGGYGGLGVGSGSTTGDMYGGMGGETGGMMGSGGAGMGYDGAGGLSTALAANDSMPESKFSETGPRTELSLAKSNEPAPRYRRPSVVESESADRYTPIHENAFTRVNDEPLSTFSIDVDTASYVKARQFLLQSHRLPPANAVRIEEFVNYFEYEYAGPKNDDPFGADLAVTDCPWRPEHKLVRIALQATKVEVKDRPKANIVFLLDVSGSMDQPNKLPLVKESMRMLIEQLGENDRVAMVVYAGAAGCVLESTTGDHQDVILGALDKLNAGGSTNGGQGIQLAYDLARDHFVPGGINRVILCTDGDFNVGVTSTDALVNMVAENAKSRIFLTVLGYGMGNTNDAMMEQISNKGNGVYGMVDSRREAQRQMVKQLAGNLITVAKDVKIQVEFNPRSVASYRLIGYENRVMAAEDFNNDKKDAGEIGAGHRVTALYEVEPVASAGQSSSRTSVDELRYQKTAIAVDPADADVGEASDELLAVKLRYKQPEGDTSKLLIFPLKDESKKFVDADRDFKWATTVAEFAMLLRNSQHKGSATWSSLLERADVAAGVSPDATRQECLDMMRVAAGLAGR